MSFNLASLIGGPAKSVAPMKEKETKKTKEIKKNGKNEENQKKSFIHGINVIFKTGTYKGYHGIVRDFYPATYELTMAGTGYVEAEQYGNIKKVGDKFLSEYGESEIIKIIPLHSDKTVRVVIYRDPLTNFLHVGLVLLDKQQFISEQLKKQGRSITEIDNLFQNKNNVFVVPLSLEDDSLSLHMSSLNIGNRTISDSLAEQLNNIHITDSSVVAPVQLLENFKEDLTQNARMLQKIMYPERNTENEIIPVLNANIVGPMYYVNVSTRLGEFTEYNPDKIQYFIKFNRSLKFKPSMLKIDQTDKRYAYVKKGPFANKKLRIKAYNEAHLKITLATNGKQLESHVIKMTDKVGNPVLNIHGHQQFKVSPIYPSHLFYFDLHLKNGKDAQVVKITDDIIKIIEKNDSNVFTERNITFNDVESEHPGFKIITGDDSTGYKQYIPYFISETPEDSEEVYDEEDEEGEMDYGDEQEEGEEGELYTESPREHEFKASFKDSERTSSEEVSLSRTQTELKTQIEKILRLLNINKQSIDIYSAANAIESIVNKIKEKLVSINYTINILTTSDAKYIILLVVLYYLLKNNVSVPYIERNLTLLFGNYFNQNDIKSEELNKSIFLKKWQNELTDEEISQSINSIRTLLLSKPKTERLKLERNINILKLVLVNADKIIQRMNNTHYNILSTIEIEDTLVPVNRRRIRQDEYEESEESSSKRARRTQLFSKKTTSEHFITIKDLLNNNIPKKEVKIIWGEGIYLSLLNHVKDLIQTKYNDTQNADFLYIKQNLNRAPFAIRDDKIKPNVKKIFKHIYENSLLTPLRNIVSERLHLN